MYCGYCGNKMNEGENFCGKCGFSNNTNNDIVYVEEKRLEPKLDNVGVVALTITVLILTILTIVCASIITKDIPEVNHLNNTISYYNIY